MTQGPEDKDGTKKRKVPKTMIFGVDLPKDEQASSEPGSAAGAGQTPAPAPASPAATTNTEAEPNSEANSENKSETPEPTKSETGEKKRKVPKTLLFETQGAMEAAVLEAAAETDREIAADAEALAQRQLEELLKPAPGETQAAPDEAAPAEGGKKRKVPKTLLLDTAALKEKAAEIEAGETPKRKVPKTLLFDPAKAAEAAAAQAAAEQAAAAASPEAEIEMETPAPAKAERRISKTLLDKDSFFPPVTPAPPPDDDAAPELNIDGPEVKLFFEVEDKAEEKIAPPEPAATDFSPPAEEKPRRKVPRTLLFNPVVGADGQDVDPQPEPVQGPGAEESAGPAPDAPRRISTRKIAKTLLNNRPSAEQIIAASQEPPLDEEEAERVVERYIARTMLDHSILFDQLSKSQHHAQEKAEEEARERLNEPFKPFIPIECKKEALPCPFTWDPTYAKEKYRYCDNCQRPVYNFAGLEIAEAEAIILKAENRAKFTLFKRTDGLYMTGDCPVAVKKRSDTILMSVGGFLLALSLVAYMAMLPKPKPKPPVAPPAVPTTAHPNTDNIPGVHKIPTSGGKRNVDSWVRDANGKLVRKHEAAPVAPPPVQQAPPPVSQPEDPVWEFPNGEK